MTNHKPKEECKRCEALRHAEGWDKCWDLCTCDCHQVKPESDWQGRFDEYFYDVSHSLTDNQVAHIKKNLIPDLLKAHTQHLREVIRGMKKDKSEKCSNCGGRGQSVKCIGGADWIATDNYNQALDDILKLLDNE